MSILYYPTWFIFYIISLLPFPVLYAFSNLLNLILFDLLKYRYHVVEKNLRRSFPEKTPEEIRQLQRAFQQYFCDLLVETLKTLSISPKAVKKRIIFENQEVFERFYTAEKSILLVLGHFGNWELIGAGFAPLPFQQLYVIYKPMKNQVFDRLIYHARTRLGNKLYSMKGTFKGMVMNRRATTATAFIADQTPSPDHAYWLTFLHQDTPVFTGLERSARKFNYPVVYLSIRRPKRGQYVVTPIILTEKPADMAETELTQMHTAMLEKDIRAQPEIWLWTHRRWKHDKPADV